MAGSNGPRPTGASGSRGLYGFDARVAHPARVYDYWLGGKDNFEADRIAGEATIAAYPALPSRPGRSAADRGPAAQRRPDRHAIPQTVRLRWPG